MLFQSFYKCLLLECKCTHLIHISSRFSTVNSQRQLKLISSKVETVDSLALCPTQLKLEKSARIGHPNPNWFFMSFPGTRLWLSISGQVGHVFVCLFHFFSSVGGSLVN